MKEQVEEIYRALRYLGLVENQYDFSTRWLGRSKSYYGAIKALPHQDISDEALVNLARNISEDIERQAPARRLDYVEMNLFVARDALTEHLQKTSMSANRSPELA